MSLRIDRRTYAQMFGPTVGDRVRLADTELFIEVERDFTVYGDEVKFGGGKVLRDGMGQSPQASAAEAPDLLITNALIVDHWGVVKADIGIKDGRIRGHRQSRQPRRSWPEYTRSWWWVPAPKSLPAKVSLLLRAVSIRISILSVHNRLPRPWPLALPP